MGLRRLARRFELAMRNRCPFADREFDVAAMALVISFVPDASKAVAEMKRVVKQQGTVAAYMWDSLGGGYVQWPLVAALGAMGVDVPPAAGGASRIRAGQRRQGPRAKLTFGFPLSHIAPFRCAAGSEPYQGHNGQHRACCRFDPVADDPDRTSLLR
jgi:hypothetical protein